MLQKDNMKTISLNRSADDHSNMMAVYGYMTTSVLVSLAVSWIVSLSPDIIKMLSSGVTLIALVVGMILMVFAVSAIISANVSPIVNLLTLYSFSAFMGLFVSVVLSVYTTASIISAFSGAVVLFGIMTLYGLVTNRDLDTIGKWAVVGLIAIIIVSVINWFIGSSLISTIVSIVSIFVFMILTAADTQNIRDTVNRPYASHSCFVLGALMLYLNFINLFLNLLSLFGDSSD